jgi:general secretion pathway protein D
MRSLRIALATLILSAAILAAGQSAKSLFNKGVDADARQDYETAYEYYKAAYDKNPKDLKYRVPYQRTRFLAAASKITRAQKLRDQGKLQEALELFVRAAEIDPSNDLAIQEIRRTRQMIQGQSAPGAVTQPSEPRPPNAEDLLRQRVQRARTPVELAQLSDVPITGLKMTSEDTKVVYETLGKLAGLNVLFDPEYQSKRIPVDLQHVTLREALDIVSMESKTFWRPITPNTIFVAQDTLTKRKELEQNVIKTFYLGNNGGGSAAGTDLQDLVATIRTILEVTRIQVVPSQNAIIMKGTPDQVALAQKLIDDLDKAKPEVVIDIVVAEVNRGKTRNLGISPPGKATVTLQGIGSTGGTTPTANPLTLASLEHLVEGNFAFSIDPATAQLLASATDSRVLQSPKIRTTDNEKGSLKIATKIPITTGSFGTPLGVTGGASIGVNTQFSYIDVGVIMEITPHVHPDGQITLKISIELSSKSGDSAPVNGVTQPIISQDKLEQTIRLKDGEVNFLGGIMTETESKTNGGLPLLGSIPILKYFFSQEQKSKVTDELVFILVPHIVRGQEISDLNRRGIDVGTQSGLELRMANVQPIKTDKTDNDQQAASAAAQAPPRTAVVATPIQPTAAPVQQQAVPPSSGQPPVVPPGAASPADVTPRDKPSAAFAGDSGTASFRLSPPNQSPTQGSTFALNVTLTNARDVHSIPLQVTYDPNVMQFVSVSNGGFLSKDGQPVPVVNRGDPTTGTLLVMAQRAPGTAGISGEGTVFSLVFIAKAKGSGVVSITVPGARNSQNQPIQAQGGQAAVTVN